MNMDADRVKEIIGSSRRFTSPFNEPCGYYIWKKEAGAISSAETEMYWEKLKYFSENVDRLVQQAFKPAFYEFYGVDRRQVSSAAQMCRQLVVESFVLDMDNRTTGCCLSNPCFLFGHYVDCLWSDGWELLYADIC